MTRGQKRLRATLTLLGTIVGAGVFGVPAMIGAWGVPLATLGFAGVTLLVLAVHLLFAEAVLDDHAKVRIAGIAQHWLGNVGGTVTGAAQTLQVFGSNTAYLILGGEFLAVLAAALGLQLPLLAWQILFWGIGCVIVLAGLGWMTRVEAFLTWLLIATMILVIGGLLGQLQWSVLFVMPGTVTFEPYGIFLFSLFGYNVIPELKDLTDGRTDDTRKAVIRATLAAAVLTYAFGVAVWLASGGLIGRGGSDLVAFLPPALAIAVPIFGLLAIITSYLTTAYDLGKMFQLDYRMSRLIALGAALGVPLILLLATDRDFLGVIGVVGAVFSAAVAVSCALMGRAALRKTLKARQGTPGWWWQEIVPLATVAALILGGTAWLFFP